MIRCKNTSMAELAEFLQRQAGGYFDHPVVDATGIEGSWDFLIGWTPRQPIQPPPSANGNGTTAPGQAADPNGILSVFEAVESELGLKVVKQKRSLPVIVVDHVNDKPEN
jgi:uncharacterized protein (TIGR03435 family)